MKTCRSCGFGLWLYNAETWTCKNGHRWTLDGQEVQSPPEVVRYVNQPAPPLIRLVPAKAQPLAAAALAGIVSGAVTATVAVLVFSL